MAKRCSLHSLTSDVELTAMISEVVGERYDKVRVGADRAEALKWSDAFSAIESLRTKAAEEEKTAAPKKPATQPEKKGA